MKIDINFNPPHIVSFKGLRDKKTNCMYVFDLDGTLANGTNEDIKKVKQEANDRNAVLVYNTGRNIKEALDPKYKSGGEDKILPIPDFLVCNNGQFIYKNDSGQLKKIREYEDLIESKTNFDAKEVFLAVKKLAQSKKYRFSEEEMKKLESFNNFKKIKESDPEFYNSKISFYEWSPSKFTGEYFVSGSLDIKDLKKDIEKILKEKGIKTKYIQNRYSEKIMDKCKGSILLQSHSLRRNGENGMNALYLCPVDKSDGVEYLKKKLNVNNEEILMAGNDNNDISLANYVHKNGGYFICVNNSSEKLKQIASKLGQNALISQYEGTKGILEGIKYISEQN